MSDAPTTRMSNAKDLGARMKIARTQRNLTQIQAAKQCGISIAMWRNYEQGAVYYGGGTKDIIEAWLRR